MNNVKSFPKDKKEIPGEVPMMYFHDCGMGTLCFKWLIQEQDSVVQVICTDCGEKMSFQSLMEGDEYED